MNLAEFSKLDAWEKLSIVEIELSRKLQEETWTVTPGQGNTYYISLLDDGEIHKVLLDGSYLSEKFSTSDCNATASTFFYDDLTKILYVHTPNNDSPAALDGSDPKYSVVAFWYDAISNRSHILERYDNVISNGGCEYWLTTSDLEGFIETTLGSSTITRESTEVYNSFSTYSCKFTGDSSNSACQIRREDIILKPRRKTKVILKHKESASGKTIKLMIKDSGSNVYLNSNGSWQTGYVWISIPNATSWVEFSLDFITHKDYSQYYFYIKNDDLTSASAYVDNIELWRYRRIVDCKVFLGSNAIPSVRQSVGDFYRPDEQIQFGSIKCQNKNGWFYKRQLSNGYLWHHRHVNLFIGKKGDKYENLTQFFGGVTGRPGFDKEAIIPVEDERVLLSKLPGLATFDSTNYPNCEDSWKDKKQPILLGQVDDINPPQSNTSTKTFKLSQTIFAGVTYGIQAIDNVYKNGTALTLTTDYTIDLTNGEFTLLCALSSGDIITCDAKGLKCDILTNGKNTPTYSVNIGDWILFLYTVLNGIDQEKIDLPKILDLRNYRKLLCGRWIADEIESIDELIKWKKSAVFQSFATLEGVHTFPYYKDTVPSDALHFYNEDYVSEPNIYEDTKQCFKRVTVKAGYLPNSGYYKYHESDEAKSADWEHNVKREILFETVVAAQFQARDLRDNYIAMLKKPPKFIEVPIKNHAALVLNPLDKAYFTYKKKDEEGNWIYKLNETVFRVLTLEKSENTGITHVTGILDDADFFWTIT